MQPKTIDHIAFWVADRQAVAETLEGALGMREIDRQDTFTLLGIDARRFKLTLFDADGPHEPGPFEYVALRVNRRPRGVPAELDVGEGIAVVLVERETPADYDLDHVALRTADPRGTAAEYERYGFAPAGSGRVRVADAFVELHTGRRLERPERPLLNHLAVLVDSAEDAVLQAEELGIEVESTVDAPNTYAAFLVGPDGVRIEYVEHKPTFALR